MGRNKKYLTDEERIAAKKEQVQKWDKDNHDRYLEIKKKYYDNNKTKYIESANKWQKLNPEKFRKTHKITMRKYYIKLTALKKIEKIGESEWMKTATDEQLEVYTEYKLKKSMN